MAAAVDLQLAWTHAHSEDRQATQGQLGTINLLQMLGSQGEHSRGCQSTSSAPEAKRLITKERCCPRMPSQQQQPKQTKALEIAPGHGQQEEQAVVQSQHPFSSLPETPACQVKGRQEAGSRKISRFAGPGIRQHPEKPRAADFFSGHCKKPHNF